jgi:hypothetical protein
MQRVSATVALAVSADALWRSVCRLDGVNYELGPIVRMTTPRGLQDADIDDLEVGVPVGRSWLLLGGLIPVDYDDLCLAEIDPPRRFLERSSMLSMSLWEHERLIEPHDDGTSVLSDRLGFELRRPLAVIPGATRLAQAIVAALFRHRHRRLAKLHGMPPSKRHLQIQPTGDDR